MASKLIEFRYLSARPGVKSQVTFQAQVKGSNNQWAATTKQTACQAQGQWILEGFPFVVLDTAGTWNGQNWNDSAPKRVLVRILGSDGSDRGIFVNQDDAHNDAVSGSSLAVLSDTSSVAYCLKTSAVAVLESASTPVNWGSGQCNFLPDPT